MTHEASTTETVHATAFVIGRHGILLRGPSGSGKSLLALECISHARARNLFARLVCDDGVRLVTQGSCTMAYRVQTIAGQAELRFYGIIAIETLAAARIDCVVEIVDPATLQRMLEGGDEGTLHVPRGEILHARHLVFSALEALDR